MSETVVESPDEPDAPDASESTPPPVAPEVKTDAQPTRDRSVITKLATFAAGNWKVTMALWGVVVAIGLVAYGGGLAREGFPPVNLPIVVVDGNYFVDDPDAVDQDVALPLQTAYAELDGVKEVQSFSQGNAYAVIVEFEDEFSSPEGAAVLEAATPSIGTPDEATITVRPIDATKFLEVYDLLVTVSGPTDATAEELEAEAAKLETFLDTGDGVERADVRKLLTTGINPNTDEEEIRQTRFVRVDFAETGMYNEAIAICLVRTADTDLDLLGFSDEI